jgi:flagellar hook-length control protein FliK
VAMMAASLNAQTIFTGQGSPTFSSMSGSSLNGAPSRTQLANASSFRTGDPDTASISGLRSPSAVMPSSAQTNSFNPFAESETDGSSAQTIKMKVSSIQAQTHFAPVQQLSPALQIAEFVASAAGDMAGADSPDGAAATANSQSPDASGLSLNTPPASMIKTLTLSLEPDSLGTVTVTMRLADSGLDLQLEAAKSATTSLIEKDKANLSDRLQSLGYAVDSVVVTTAPARGANQDPTHDQSAAGQGQQQAGSDAPASGLSQNGGRNGNDQSPAQRGGETTAGLNQESVADPSAARTIGDGIFV